jgi:hypothetical protein
MIYTAFRVFNAAKSKILVFRYKKTKVWSIPTAHKELSPLEFLDFLSSMLVLGRSFHFMSFIPILVSTDKEIIWNEDLNRYVPVKDDLRVFDFQYEGVISPLISSTAEKYFDSVCWVAQDNIMDLRFINKITKSFYLNFKSKCLLNQR